MWSARSAQRVSIHLAADPLYPVLPIYRIREPLFHPLMFMLRRLIFGSSWSLRKGLSKQACTSLSQLRFYRAQYVNEILSYVSS